MRSSSKNGDVPMNLCGHLRFSKRMAGGDTVQDCQEPLQEGGAQRNGNVKSRVGADHVNFGLDDQMEIQGFVRDRVRTVITWVFIVLSLGSLRLVFHWYPRLMLYATHRPCSLDVAEQILVTESYQQTHKCYHVRPVKIITSQTSRELLKEDDQTVWDQRFLLELDDLDACKLSVHVSGGTFKEMEEIRMFSCKKMTYIWDPDEYSFFKLKGLDWDVFASVLHQCKGLSVGEQFFRRAVFGNNEIIVPMRSVVALLFLEVLDPFYIFQIFSFILWAIDDYIFYALAIALMSCVSIGVAVVQTRKNQTNLSNRVHSSDLASVLRKGFQGEEETVMVATEHLVPGDVMVLPSHGCIMHCDAVLLTGNCIVNESMLTGESVPVTKTPLPNSSNVTYNEKEHARHTLFCGTQVIQTRYYGNERVYAVVIRTSFSTAKGSLVRSILYPPPVDFKFERDSYKFVWCLAFIAFIGVIYTFATKISRNLPLGEIILEALDLITIVVPPALPAAMTVGRMYAQTRLERSKIFCISPRTINVSGSINCVCFDKTGTLTEDGLDLWGVVPVTQSRFLIPVREFKSMRPDHLLRAMVTCHSLTIIDGNLAGDPLDIKIFESSGWILEEPPISDDTKFDLLAPTVIKPPSHVIVDDEDYGVDFEIGIIRQFPFSSSLQRMSVITRVLGGSHFTLYCKGSPEMVTSLCEPSTIPADFDSELEGYTKEGYRVLGVAYRDIPKKMSYTKIQRLTREDAESKLIFLGLVVMENQLKPQTSPVLHMLGDANIRMVMVTGDNMLTALSVARDCGMVSPTERVIMVNATSDKNPQIYFTQSKPSLPRDSSHLMSQLTEITETGSIASLQTITPVGNKQFIPNGTARNSIITELPLDEFDVEAVMAIEKDNNYSFALTGSTWTVLRTYFPEIMKKVATRGAVFARMSPDHKQQLVQELQNLDYFVAMVGDGANDCGALKAAHAGISLSEAESSVASPFTSKEPNISCIVQVIREGRAALVTSFSIFKYMAAYSLMQFASVVILYSIDSNLTDIEYLYIDLFVISTFAFVLGRVEAYKGPLYPEPPHSSLLSFIPILSLFGQMVIAIAAQLASFVIVKQYENGSLEVPSFVTQNETDNYTQSFLDEFNLTTNASTLSPEKTDGLENYAVFSVSCFQYIILALVFSKGAPYRQSIFATAGLMLASTIITVFTLYLILFPCSFLVHSFELFIPHSVNFRLLMVVIVVTNLICATIYELFCDLIQRRLSKLSRRKLLGYEELDRIMKKDGSWPPLSVGSPHVEHSPVIHRSTPTVTLVNSPPPGNKSLETSGVYSMSDLQLEEMKFSTPMRSMRSLVNRKTDGQSEDSLTGYLTPPTSMGSATPADTPKKVAPTTTS
uniref:Cation-transporting ATPase n=1 Tax=Lygus hesperus TaxID=30085 RepID=A0A146M0L3_LYGHE